MLFRRKSSQEIKQVLVIRADLKMGKGKLVAQGAHAAVSAYLDATKKHPDWAKRWIQNGQKKIAVKINGEREILELEKVAVELGLPCALIRDAGHTQLAPGTITVLGIGPAPEKKVDALTGDLKLL